MPFSCLLVGVSYPTNRDLIKVTSANHQANRQAVIVKATVQANSRDRGHIIGRGIARELVPAVASLDRRCRDGCGRRDEYVDAAQNLGHLFDQECTFALVIDVSGRGNATPQLERAANIVTVLPRMCFEPLLVISQALRGEDREASRSGEQRQIDLLDGCAQLAQDFDGRCVCGLNGWLTIFPERIVWQTHA